MRQSSPHRNKIHLLSLKSKGFVRRPQDLPSCATFLPQHFRRAGMSAQKIRMTNNGLVVSLLGRVFSFPQTNMAGMRTQHGNNVRLIFVRGSHP